MASRLQQLRKEAGFASQRGFADEMGVAQGTYARWEADPAKIPTREAWRIADRLGASIDEVVGRTAPEADGRDEAMRDYEGLSPRSRSEAADFIAFLAKRDARDAARAAVRDETLSEAQASLYEDTMLASMAQDPERLNAYVESGDGEKRAAFESYVREAAAWSKKGERLDAFVGDILAAWDRLHGSHDDPDANWHVFWSETPRMGGGAGEKK